MTPKEYLSQIRKINITIECKEKEIQSLRNLVTSITPNYESDPVQSSGSKDKISNAIVKIIDLQNEINADIDKLIDLKADIFSVIQKLDPIEFGILHKRYFEFESWGKIANELTYSERQIYRIHGEALAHLKDVIECQYKTC